MRLLFTVDPEIEVPPKTYGGIERIVDALVRHLQAAGHELALIAKPGSECPANRFFPWPGSISQSTRDTLVNAWALSKAVRTFRPHVIHSFARLAYLAPHLRGRIPIVMSYQRYPTMRTIRMALRLAKPGVVTFTGCSEYIARAGRPAGGDWYGIPNFADTEALQLNASVPGDAPLVFLSRVETIKGADWAIEVARRTGRRLIIAGNHAEAGAEGAYWTERIAPCLGRDGIEYVGPVDDVQKNALLRQALAMVVPIQWDEPFGIVFAESLACGTPVISCPRGALPEIVRPGIDGFLVRSIEEGCAAVERVAALDRSACRRRAEERFSPRAVVAQYLDLYERVRTRLGTAR